MRFTALVVLRVSLIVGNIFLMNTRSDSLRLGGL